MNDHPELEDLSAFVDGEAPQWGAHVDACAACQADVGRLHAVSAAVGRPVPALAADVRERALALALDASVEAAGSGQATTGRVRPIPLAAVKPPVLAPSLSPPPVPRRGMGRTWMTLGSVAAVLLAVVVGATVLRTGGGGSDTSQTLAAGSPDEAEKRSSGPAYESPQTLTGDASGASGGITADIGDLGAVDLGVVDDASTLMAKAGATLRRDVQGTGSASAAEAAPAPTAAGTRIPARDSPARNPNLAPTAVGTRPCEMQLREARPDLREVVYFATATSKSRPAFVLGFATGPDPAPVTLLLVAQEGCAILVESALP